MTTAAHVITVSDRASAGVYEDTSGPLAADGLADAGFDVTGPVLVPDEPAAIAEAIREALTAGARVVLTTGGTGVGPRDHTVEVTRSVIDVELPGIAEEIRRVGKASTPLAVISRGVVGCVRERRAVVVNAPGSRGGVRDTLAVVLPLLPHLLDQLAGGDHSPA